MLRPLPRRGGAARGRAGGLAPSPPTAACAAAGAGAGVALPATASCYERTLVSLLDRTAVRRQEIVADRLQVAGCWAALLAAAPERRLRLVQEDARFHSWPAAALILGAAGGEERRWELAGREVCRLALAIADRLPAGLYPAAQANDLRARAWMAEADALRAAGRVGEARASLERALRAQWVGSGDALDDAALRCLEADLDLEDGDFAAAAPRLRCAATLYRLLGERHEEGRAQQKLALAVGFLRPLAGVAEAERALTLIEPYRDLDLDLTARHTLIWLLNDGGLAWRALDLLARTRGLYRQLRDSAAYGVLPWLEGRICRRLGDLAAAQSNLSAMWHHLRANGVPRDLALVSLDLASVYLQRGKPRPALRPLERMADLLERARMHEPGMAAWRQLTAAVAGARQEQRSGGGPGPLSAEAVLPQVSLYFRQAWRRPLPFELAAAGPPIP